MGAMCQQVVRASTPLPGETENSQRTGLPPQVVESAATRLGWVSLICAFMTVSTVIVQRYLQPEIAAAMKDNPIHMLVSLVLVLLSLGIVTIQRLRLLAPTVILKLGLVFQVLVAFVLSFAETSLQLPAEGPVVGISKLALWIVFVGLLIPNKPWIILITALAAAFTWPAAYALNLSLFHLQPLPGNRFAVWLYLPFVMAFVTYALSKRMYMMEVAVERARELGSYNLVSRIGSGGMGEVWRAEHRMLARDAAIKVVRSELLISQAGSQAEITRRRFEREAQAIASLQSPHTVYLFDFGSTQDCSFYYVMELLDGISLEVLVEKFGPQPPARVIHMLRQVCESLEEAHRSGLIHRDIKPSNIYACRVGIEYDFMKVLDFGLVKDVSPRNATRLTIDGTAAGTPAYMAPETALGETTIDGRVDIYGLGCVAYYLLTGSPVFEEKTPTATAIAHIQKEPVPPSQRSELPIPSDLERIILRCLAKKPEDRPRSAQDLANQLAACADASLWTREQSAEWWQIYLPESSSYRVARRSKAALAANQPG